VKRNVKEKAGKYNKIPTKEHNCRIKRSKNYRQEIQPDRNAFECDCRTERVSNKAGALGAWQI
jgi:hypothetical protein